MLLADFWENLIGILAVTFIFGGWVITSVVSSLAKSWRKTQESEHQAALKQTMIEKGMTADEIERVLRAGPVSDEPQTDDDGNTIQATEPSVTLANELIKHEVSASDLERILNAFRAVDPAKQKALSASIGSMLNNGADGERILVTMRALAGVPNEQRTYPDSASSFRH